MRTVPFKPNGKYFQLHGEGFGGKLMGLIEKTAPILESGLFLSERRHGFGWSIACEYMKRCGALDAALEGDYARARKLILDGKFSQAEWRLIGHICRDLCGYPALMVRSSAEGEASGTGIYESCECINRMQNVATSIRRVLASYFAEDAVLFRKDVKLEEGMAVMIEPMIAENVIKIEGYESRRYADEKYDDCEGKFERNGYAPRLSGFAVTSKRMLFEGKELYRGPEAGIVQGLAKDYIVDAAYGTSVEYGEGKRISFERATYPYRDKLKSSFHGSVLFIGESGKIRMGNAIFRNYEKILTEENTQLQAFFGQLEKLEETAKVRQKIEFAMKLGDGKPCYVVTQIVDAPYKKLKFDADRDAPNTIGWAENVHNEADRACDCLVYINAPCGWENLSRMREKYVAITDQKVESRCNYSLIRNAVGIATTPNAYVGALADISDHFGGILHMTDKILMSLERLDFNKLAKKADMLPEGPYGLDIYKAKFRIAGSEYTNQGILEIRE